VYKVEFKTIIKAITIKFKEELNLEILIKSHFYTTDFYVPSFFNPQHQLISVYYLIERKENFDLKTSTKRFDFEPIHGSQSLRWLTIKEIEENELTYPIDKKVILMLKNSYYI
jgi:ADP-ribose pyrophosphatase YjhB (NUDIX family)